MTHTFDRTILREYDIRGIVGKTLHEADAYALGRTLRRARNGRRRDARRRRPRRPDPFADPRGGADPRAHRGRARRRTTSAWGRARCSISPSSTLDVQGGIQVTGSHNPADYNGFKMLLNGRSVFGEEIQELGRRAADGDWSEGTGLGRAGRHRSTPMSTGWSRAFEGGAFRIGWDAGNGAAGPSAREADQAAAGRALRDLHRGRRPLSQPSPRPDGRGQPRRPEGAGRREEARFRHRVRRRRRPDRRGRRQGPRRSGATSC